jgi:hypothetical protein
VAAEIGGTVAMAVATPGAPSAGVARATAAAVGGASAAFASAGAIAAYNRAPTNTAGCKVRLITCFISSRPTAGIIVKELGRRVNSQ